MPALPDWYTPGDPLAGRRMRTVLAIGEGEAAVRGAADTAIAAFLDLARAGVLGEATPQALTAAGNDDLPPDVDGGWPTLTQWGEILQQHLIPAISVVFGQQFYAEARRAAISVTPYVSHYMEQVFDRLVIWPTDAFNDVRAELQEGLTEGDSIARLRDRIASVLDADAPSRPLQAEINVLTRTIEDDDTPASVRREARARRKLLYRRLDDADRRWKWKAARIARTETLGAFNGGTYMGAAAVELATGVTRYKQWWSTSDNRVRASHWAAHMQVTELHDHFQVGGYLLDHPGDPTAPGEEVINCRCTILILNEQEAQRERARYAADRPARTNIDGQLIDDEGNPIGPAPVQQGFSPHPLTADARGQHMPTPPVLAATEAGDTTSPPVEPSGEPVGFRGRLAPLDQISGDGRIIGNPATLRVRPLPIGFKWQDASTFGHDNAVVIGALTKVWIDGGYLWGSGPLDVQDPEGAEFTRKLRDGFAGLVSVDLDDTTSEWRIIAPDGGMVEPEDIESILEDDGDGWMTLPEGYREVEVVTDWRLMSTTGVADPAFPEARVFAVYDTSELVPIADLIAEREREANASATQSDVALVAAGGPLAAPHAWFVDPKFDSYTPWTVTEDGRVFGHFALFDRGHIGYGGGRYVPAPRGADYSLFHIKAYRTADNGDIAVGAVVMGTDHASTSAATSVSAAMAHYADNGHCVAYVRMGEDEFGPWGAGVLVPGLSDVDMVKVRAMTLSGDWRTMGGKVSFIAALAVNVPGFPVPRRTTGDDGQLVALVAAGAPMPVAEPPKPRGSRVRMMPTAREFAREVLAEMRQQERAEQAAALTQRMRAGQVAAMAARVNRPARQHVDALAARVHGGR